MLHFRLHFLPELPKFELLEVHILANLEENANENVTCIDFEHIAYPILMHWAYLPVRKVVQQHTKGMVGSVMYFAGYLLLFSAMEEFRKSIKNWQSYRSEFDVVLFLGQSAYFALFAFLGVDIETFRHSMYKFLGDRSASSSPSSSSSSSSVDSVSAADDTVGVGGDTSAPRHVSVSLTDDAIPTSSNGLGNQSSVTPGTPRYAWFPSFHHPRRTASIFRSTKTSREK